MLDSQDVAFFEDNGFLHIPEVFTPDETQELSDELDRLVAEWALTSPGWEGNWRNIYMDPEVARQSKLTAMHDLQFYSEVWFRGITNPRLVDAVSALIGPNVELHHSTLHIKPPQSGHPFPMHQDSPFYPHRAKGFVDVLVHLDDTNEENGEIRFLAGSHNQGALEHLTAEGVYYYLPPDDYRLEETVAVPARKGDVVAFHLWTVHGSYINRTQQPRRLVRIGFRDPQNPQVAGQSFLRPNILLKGYRDRAEGQELLRNS